MSRPKNKAIPDRIKREVVERQGGICGCGCKQPVHWKNHGKTTRFDHTPARFLRPVNDAGTDLVPPQNDPNAIVARCLESDEIRRSGGRARATTAGRETNAVAKQRRRDKPPKPKRRWPSRPMQSAKKPWPKRSFQKRVKT